MLWMGLWQRTHITDNEMFSSLAKNAFYFRSEKEDIRNWFTGTYFLFLLSVSWRNVISNLSYSAMYTNSYDTSPFVFTSLLSSTFLFKYFQTNDRRISTWSYFASHLTFSMKFFLLSCRKQISAFSSTDLRSSIGFTASAAGNEGVEGSNHYLISRFPSISPGFGSGEALINCEMMHERGKFSGRRNFLLGDS